MKFIAIIVGAAAVTAAPLPQTAAKGALEAIPTHVDTTLNQAATTSKDMATRSNRRRQSRGGLEGLTNPAVMGVANPIVAGAGRGVAGAAAGTQQTADDGSDAIDALLHTVGDITGSAEQGASAAAPKAAPAVQGTVHQLQNDKGLAGDIVKVVTRGH